MGYHRAGFEVVGVDIKPQPHYPFEFHQADAFEYLRDHGHEFDAIHASPPCQAHSALKTMPNSKQHDDLLTPMRRELQQAGKPFVIENVVGAPMFDALTLCGTMFDLGVGSAELRRHRIFECSHFIPRPGPCRHYMRGKVIGVYGGHGRDRRRVKPKTVTIIGHAGWSSVRDGTQQFSTDERKIAMGIDWMNGNELSQAIPPAYTEYIGRKLLEVINQ